MTDYPITVHLEAGDWVEEVEAQAVSQPALDGFLAIHEPVGMDPAGHAGLFVRGNGGALLVRRDAVLTIEGDHAYLRDLLDPDYGDGGGSS